MKIRAALLASSLAIPVAAQAQPAEGLYISALGGVNVMSDQTIKSVTVGPGVAIPLSGQRLDGHIGMSTGASARAAVGWGFGRLTDFGGPRVELEGDYLYNAFSGSGLRDSVYRTTNFTGNGNEQKYGVMVNVLWDFDIGQDWIYPYLGGGIGNIWSVWNANNANPSPLLGLNAGLSTNNTQSSFAYQAILGADFPIRQVPGLALVADFRFLGLTGHRNYGASYSGPALGGGLAINRPLVVGTAENYNYTFSVGLRYRFGAAPPPPPPVPAPVAAPTPAPSRTYLVFFDWNRADLTDRARQIIAEAAQNSTRVQYTRIEVAGHADHTGTAQYNQALSLRRAENVAAELVRNGVPRQAIAVQGFGFSRPLVPTAPGVREPQNRRVEIVLK
ncbi:Outer membrane protein [Rhodovastum atsumiense]|uniref:OmpA family protein n=1 Tax=Rhodovastum atsumiense TaxID=504468 RepID=A0A5M6IUW8_9PROT|nr:OmpA family protein [Rhodovastum atsumiense]KAA5611205.1 OmpA family protein [Rhodovastum atsumiense]CAH2602486.1 Outer membrane protein [Rhodovastum atsumiense]